MKTKETYNLRFFARENKRQKSSLLRLYVRVTVNSERKEVCLGMEIPQGVFDAKAQTCLRKTTEAKRINEFLQTIRFKFDEYRKKLLFEDRRVTAESLRRMYMNIPLEDEVKVPTILELYDEHNEKLKESIDIDISAATHIRHETSRKHVQRFIEARFEKDDYELKDINTQFLDDYRHYLKVTRKCNQNTAKKYINNLGKVIRISLASGFIKKDPFLGFKMRYEKVIKPHLTEEEIQILLNKDFGNERLEAVRDVFVFCCLTGLAFIDVKDLTMDSIKKGMDGKKYIFNNRHKTLEAYHVPIFPLTQQLIDKYKDHPKRQKEKLVLPVISNQKMNAYLKEIATVCGINKHLSTHVARHTFATTVTLNNGVPIEAVSKMLGHSNIKITQQYAKVTESLVSKSTEGLHEKFGTAENDNPKTNYDTGFSGSTSSVNYSVSYD